ncbi:hypothetical protein CspeluHIS016_0702710 [Cutaneotrichosporon spelunceum]|uniref:Uncharacterized protein n=1 Tax=Cutaneotrichosporon spelunceum TaxID=1672016 RepID=A0AAD3YDL5_9TREE|nr:hypothetical protein CspeluHIS016_0702710 [Cutaneotrichosporon spelunceum]
MHPPDVPTSSPAFYCRWNYCTVSHPTLGAISSHLRDHISAERPVYIPVAKRRRTNGGWVLDDTTNSTLPFPPSFSTLSQRSGHTSRRSIDDFLPPADVSDLGLGVAVPGTEVDFDAFLRSPSPPRRPMSSTPLSQVPPPSEPSQLSQPFQSSPCQPSSGLPPLPPAGQRQPPSQSSDASSGALVSPPSSMPPPTQAPPPTADSNVSASPRPSLQFGFADTPRRVSAGGVGVGFDWGTGK